MATQQEHRNLSQMSWSLTWEGMRLKYGIRLINEKAAVIFNYVGLENIESWTGKLNKTSNEQSEEDAATANKFYSRNVLLGKLRPYPSSVTLSR